MRPGTPPTGTDPATPGVAGAARADAGPGDAAPGPEHAAPGDPGPEHAAPRNPGADDVAAGGPAAGGVGGAGGSARRTVEAVWRLEAAKIVAALTRMTRDVGLAEEAAQEALLAALEQWPDTGVPDAPGAWLMTIAKRRAVDQLRRAERFARRAPELARDVAPEPDDVLRLMFLSCHPVLPPEQRTALTLRLVAGLTTAEIARAFLVADRVIAQRVATAKRTLAESGAPFEADAARLPSVLGAIYLIFNEGYSATSGDDLMRPTLCLEALRLGRLLAELAPREPEVHGLAALMEIQASRTAARTDPDGQPVQLHEQDRGRWDPLLIRRGFEAMLRARALGGTPGPYVLQAAIAVCHAQARSADDTDWAGIAALYGALEALLPTPVVRLNRAVAVGRAEGPAAGLALADALLTDPALKDYHLLPGVRADLLLRLGRVAEARREFTRAAALTRNAAERAFLLRRAATLHGPASATPDSPASASPDRPAGTTPDRPASTTLGAAAPQFLARLGDGTARSYGQTLTRLRASLGDDLPLPELTADRVAAVFAAAWRSTAPGTWNRHRAAVRAFAAWASLGDLVSTVERRPAPRAAAAPVALSLDGAGLRERTLWHMLRESGATVRAVLALDVEDLDLDGRCARRDGTRITWRSTTAHLLPQLLDGRTRGPLFLAERRPGPGRRPAPADLCPTTGRSRLSYERAEYLFKQATGHTLRRLRTLPPQ